MKLLIITLLSIVFVSHSFGQKERSINRAGVKKYISGEYNDAEVDFMKALDEDSTSFAANYNRAASLYKLEKYKEANEIFAGLAENTDSQDHLHDLMHNLGNNLMKQEMYDQSIEAYKNALRLQSDDEDSRYNLAYAQVKLKQQEEENKDKDKDKDKDENKDENKDQQDKDDQEDQKDEQNQDEEQKDQEEKQQEQTKELSQDDIERILQAIQEQEKDVKEKVEKQKAKAQKVKTEKDW